MPGRNRSHKEPVHRQVGSDRDFPDQSPNMRYLGNGLVLNKNAYEYASWLGLVIRICTGQL